jgi:ABC-type nickel/cobalt efflux system permease component RcnA
MARSSAFTLPAALLALAGGSIAALDHAHLWVTRLAIAAVIAAWLWIVWQRLKRQRPITHATMALMIAASLDRRRRLLAMDRARGFQDAGNRQEEGRITKRVNLWMRRRFSDCSR